VSPIQLVPGIHPVTSKSSVSPTAPMIHIGRAYNVKSRRNCCKGIASRRAASLFASMIALT
jgi:hypothetical protein